MARKYPPLDVLKMFSTLTLEHWESCLRKAVKSGSVEKLMAWRYGLQAGLSDVAAKGLNTEQLDIWVIKRCRDLEKCARHIIKKRHPNPLDNPNKDRIGYVASAVEAKKKRDREFQNFLMRSNF